MKNNFICVLLFLLFILFGYQANAVEYSELTNSELSQKEKILSELNINTSYEKIFLKLNDEQFKKVLTVLDKSVQTEYVQDFLLLDDIHYQEAVNILNRGGDVYNCIMEFLELDHTSLEKVVTLISKKVKIKYIKDLILLDDIHFQKVITLLDKGVDEYYVKDLAELDDFSYKKVLLLLNKEVDIYYIKDFIKFSNKNYNKTLNLIDIGVNPYYVKDLLSLDNVHFKLAIMLINQGNTPFNVLREISHLTKSQVKTITNILKQDFIINYHDAQNIALNKANLELYKQFISQGYNAKIASVMANIDNINNYDIKEISQLLYSINAAGKLSSNTSDIVSKYLADNPDLYLSDLIKYINNINIEELIKTIPKINDFCPEQFLKFIDYHYKNGTTVFNIESLTFKENLTDYLTENYTDADKLTDLLTAFPATPREVGSIPKSWLDKIPVKNHKQVIKNIYLSIQNFQDTRDIVEFSNQLENILCKKIAISHIGTGFYGHVYRIQIAGANDVCLKIFYKKTKVPNIHGQHIEVQSALFINKNSDMFVKMYFGKVSSVYESDGFMVTQYLADNISPEPTGGIESKYIIISEDMEKHNIINKKIFDFGGVKVKTKDGIKISTWE